MGFDTHMILEAVPARLRYAATCIRPSTGHHATKPGPCLGTHSRTRQVVHPDGSVHSCVPELPRDQWEVLIRDHHPGYITWEAYLANEAKLAANRTNGGARPPPRSDAGPCRGGRGGGVGGARRKKRRKGATRPGKGW
jgi:hypothetical protein